MSEDLIRFARTRDPELRGELAVRHLPLVKFVARKLSANLPDHIELDDLISWGSLGLIDSIDKFDPGRGLRFSTYAVTRIRGAMLDGLQQMDWAPKQITSKVRALRRLREKMTNELGYEPSIEEMAEQLQVDVSEIRGWMLDDETTRMKSLDGASDTDPGDDFVRDIDDGGSWEHDLGAEVSELRTRMAIAISGLGEREAAVLTLYYRDGLTLRQIAERLGVSASSAIQVHTHLVEQVRERLRAVGGVHHPESRWVA